MRNKILAVLILALLSCVAAAQTTTIKGKVLDREGKPMEGAKVTFKSLDDGTKYEIKVNKKGEYFSLGIKPGSYNVVLSKDGQSLFTLNKVPVTFDDTHNVFDIDLQKEQGAKVAGQTEVAVPEGVSTEDAAQKAPPAGSTGGAPAPPRDPNAPIVLTEEQQKKLTPEQKKEYEEYQKGVQENMRRKGLNAILVQAQTAAKAGNFDESIRLLQGVTQQAPDIPLSWAILGQYQSESARRMTDRTQRAQRATESVASFDKALQLHAANPDPKVESASWRVGLGSAYDMAGKYDDALKAFTTAAQEAATSNPKTAALAHYNTGLVLAKTGKVEEAAAEFDKAVQLDPTLTEAYYQKGTALIAKATTDKAGKIVAPPGTEEAFEKYLEVAPNGKNVEAATAQLQFLGAKVKTSVRNK